MEPESFEDSVNSLEPDVQFYECARNHQIVTNKSLVENKDSKSEIIEQIRRLSSKNKKKDPVSGNSCRKCSII